MLRSWGFTITIPHHHPPILLFLKCNGESWKQKGQFERPALGRWPYGRPLHQHLVHLLPGSPSSSENFSYRNSFYRSSLWCWTAYWRIETMNKSSGAFQRIESDFKAFQKAIERCSKSSPFAPSDFKDAYAALSRLRDRFCVETKKHNLTEFEHKTLSKVFMTDNFIKGTMNLRLVAEHVKIDEDFIIWTPDNQPVSLDTGSSATVVFSAPVVNLPCNDGSDYLLDHLKHLRVAEERISRAMAKAKA